VGAGTCEVDSLIGTLPDGSLGPFVPVSSATTAGLGDALLEDSSGSYGASLYGAYSFGVVDPASGSYDLSAHANFTAQHAGPMYLNLMGSSILREATGQSDAAIVTTMHPLPLTEYQNTLNDVRIAPFVC
jgi:hypothetical protein